jgi:hypothetical protein
MPQVGTPRYARVHRRVYVAIVSFYLLYTIRESYLLITKTPNYYDILTVPLTVTPQELKSRFRRLTVQYHPDKAGADGAEYFITLKEAYETLSDPTRRFAYDRFGADMLEWTHCTTLYDYVLQGAEGTIPFYGPTLMLLVILSVLGKFQTGRWWRYYILITLWVFDLTLLSRPYPVLPTIPFTKPLLAFEIVTLARNIVIPIFIAFNQLGPYLIQQKQTKSPTMPLEERLGQLAALATHLEKEAALVQHTEIVPFEHDPQALKQVERGIGNWLVEMQVRNDPEIRDAMGKALQRRRQGAPAGARGTR